jgi:predicted O-linked N-acetylglucosamine transferase (SPINDLY family)
VLLQALQQAWAWYSGNEWNKAEQACRLVLAARPSYFDALNLLGIITAQTGRPQEAADILGRAIAQRRDDPIVHNNYGNVLRDLKRHSEALNSYERAARIKPDYAEAYYNRGVTLQELKRLDEALESYGHALAAKPDYAAAYNNSGAVLRELKRFEDALRCYQRALEINPGQAVAHNNRGIALQDLKRFEEALQSHDRALELSPNLVEALDSRGNALRNLRRNDEALDSYDRALCINPTHAESHNGRGATLYALQRPQEALASYERALAVRPDSAETHFNCANVLRDLGRFDLAQHAYERAVTLDPEYAEAHYSRGTLMCDLQRFDEARISFERALATNPGLPWLQGLWLHTKMRLCDWEGLDAEVAGMLARVERSEKVATPFSMIPLTDSGILQRRVSELWGGHAYPATDALPPLVKPSRRERIRIGYYSADFYMHATANLVAELFERHDRDRFEIIGFEFGPAPRDAMTERLAAAFDRFIDVRSMSDLQVAQLSRDLQIDIAVDLKGFTQHQRVAIFAHRAAPVQVNFLGYPGTLGASYIDYIVADHTLIPEASRELYSEKVIYLPDSYQVNDRRRQIMDRQWSRAQLQLPPDGFVFCSFNSAYKITPATFDGWMRILQAVPGSVLWLLENDPRASENLRRSSAARGVDPRRLIFAPPLPLPEHLARYRAADLFLDTLPCNAHTTASDALWAGLPVLTCAGEAFAARVAASLLNAMELPELVTVTRQQYERVAIELANIPDRLATLRQKVQANRLSTALFDTPSYTRHLEDAYTQIYERSQAGLAPDHILVRQSRSSLPGQRSPS